MTQDTNPAPITTALERTQDAPALHRNTRLRTHLGAHNAASPVTEAAEDFLKVKEIATVMRVSSSVVVRLIKEGRLPALNVSSGTRPTYRVSREAFEKFKSASVLPASKVMAPPAKPSLPPGVRLWV